MGESSGQQQFVEQQSERRTEQPVRSCVDVSREAQEARVAAMTPLERLELAIRLSHIARELAARSPFKKGGDAGAAVEAGKEAGAEAGE